MAFSKAKDFPPLLQSQSFWSKALGHPARIMILTHLLHHGRSPYQDLRKNIPLAATTVSQHLRYLRDAELIFAGEHFPHTWYDINSRHCAALAQKMRYLEQDFSASLPT